MISRRRLLAAAPALLASQRGSAGTAEMLTVHTFGDSILDCGHYNAHGVHPGQLIVRNNDMLFPEFKGRDVQTRRPARLEHRAKDGATISGLPLQTRTLEIRGEALALVTIGSNDLLGGLGGERARNERL